MNSRNLYYGQKGFISTADRLEAQGIQKGIKQGIEQGIEKGIEKGIELGAEKVLIEKLRMVKRKKPEWTLQEIADLFEVELAFVKKHLDSDSK